MSVDATPQEAKEITDAARIEAFLTDPVIAGAVLQLAKSYFEGWKSSKDAEEQAVFGYKGRVIDDLLLELKKVVDTGAIAKAHLERRQRNPGNR